MAGDSVPTIVCVDDDTLILRSLREQLLRGLDTACDIELASSAEEALALIDELDAEGADVPLIISDQVMPGQHGADLLADTAAQHGYAVERGVAGLETSFVATSVGEDPGPTVAFVAEYDALPGIGHACGHNIIGTAALGAGLAIQAIRRDLPVVGGQIRGDMASTASTRHHQRCIVGHGDKRAAAAAKLVVIGR